MQTAVYKVKNWARFQHYRTRRPPWIKLHRTLLDDCVFLRLQPASRALAPLVWLLASESDDGTFGGDLAFRLRLPQKEVDQAIKDLVAAGYIECLQGASTALAACKQNLTTETETETETEREREADGASAPAASRRFSPPTPEEADSYAEEIGLPQPERIKFLSHYGSNGWKVGRNPMKDWRCAMRGWLARLEDKPNVNGNGGQLPLWKQLDGLRAESTRLSDQLRQAPFNVAGPQRDELLARKKAVDQRIQQAQTA